MDDFTLNCFLAVADTASFTKAAIRVKRTQSAVTQQISNLEKTLGRKLFQRGKSLSLTKDGEVFLSYAHKIFGLYREVLDRFKQPELEGEIRFGLPEDFASMFLSDVLIDFSRIHPRILLDVECDLTLNLYERFKKGVYDIVLVKMSRPEDFPNGVEVWTEPLGWIANNKYIGSIDKNLPLPLVLAPSPCVYRTRALQALENAGIPWRIVFTSPSHAGTIAAVKAGMGVTVFPRGMIPNELDFIQKKMLPDLPDIHVSLLKKTDKNECLNTLEDFLLKKLAQNYKLF